ncbi:hypothetical protein COUCH_14080 [Couchioplanes caeruleus]|uniref:DUF6985 domain-containing protein n=1 Tax=Couchioplanes caeruleus TaxID=56438 RepID=UPI0020C105E8|nr:hypothetical protein [Couchioplanes caeruleus]UQU67322.1 hypothetical protein COUCH_14080 [Couchioplanes caeruleus]
MQIPGLGPVTRDDDAYLSEPVPVPVLGGGPCRFAVEGYDGDEAPEDFHAAIRTFLANGPDVLRAAAPHIFAYYRDVMTHFSPGDEDYVEIAGPADVLGHVRPGAEPVVSRDRYGDGRVHVSVECECAWEPEHGLQIVFRDGRTVSKVGPYDGHLTNGSAEVYRSFNA